MVKNLIVFSVFLLPTLSRIGTRKLQSFVVRLVPWKAMQHAVEVVDVLHNTSVDIIKSRKVALKAGEEAENLRGKNIMSILCETRASPFCTFLPIDPIIVRANEKADSRDKLSDEEVVAQIS